MLYIKSIKIENRISKTQLEIFELKKAIPSPVENMFNVMSAAAYIFLSGRPEKESFYNDMLNISKGRYKNKEHHAGEEKIRSI